MDLVDEQHLAGNERAQDRREVARPFLPAEVVERKKMGFALPIGRWFKGPLRTMLGRWLLDEPHLAALGFRGAAVERLIQEHCEDNLDHTHRLFALLMLAIWTRWLHHPTPPPPLPQAPFQDRPPCSPVPRC